MDINQLKNIIRVGRVSSVDGKTCTARVTFPDKDDLVSADLPILQMGSKNLEGYWMPAVDTQVLCLFLPNPAGKGINKGFILGAFYSTADPPPEKNTETWCQKFPDGSYIRVENGTIEIHGASAIKITAPRIDLN